MVRDTRTISIPTRIPRRSSFFSTIGFAKDTQGTLTAVHGGTNGNSESSLTILSCTRIQLHHHRSDAIRSEHAVDVHLPAAGPAQRGAASGSGAVRIRAGSGASGCVTISAGLRWDHYQLLLNRQAVDPRFSIARYFLALIWWCISRTIACSRRRRLKIFCYRVRRRPRC